MPNYRREKINDAVLNELSGILREVKDPRITDAFVTITAADVAPDMKTARVYFSHLSPQDEDKQAGKPSVGTREVMKGLTSAMGFMRRELAHRLNLRATPEMTFIYDDSMRHGAQIATILNKIEHDEEKTK